MYFACCISDQGCDSYRMKCACTFFRCAHPAGPSCIGTSLLGVLHGCRRIEDDVKGDPCPKKERDMPKYKHVAISGMTLDSNRRSKIHKNGRLCHMIDRVAPLQ